MLKDAEPVGDMVSWLGFPGTVKRHYEAVTMPDGYLVLGDAFVALNPRFGNGMSIAGFQVRCMCMRAKACMMYHD